MGVMYKSRDVQKYNMEGPQGDGIMYKSREVHKLYGRPTM